MFKWSGIFGGVQVSGFCWIGYPNYEMRGFTEFGDTTRRLI
jgi:hypothetical protein